MAMSDNKKRSETVISTKKNKNYRIYLNNTENPKIIFWNFDTNYKYSVECEKSICDVHHTESVEMLRPDGEGAYVFYASTIDFNNLPLPRNPKKMIWALIHEESPKNIAEFTHEKALNLFNFSSTFSRHSNVPFPLQHMGSLEHITNQKYFVKTTTKNQALRELSPILYMQSICDSLTERDKYVKELMKFQHIDSYGDCLKNKHSTKYSKRKGYDYLNNLWEENLLRFIARYKFVITIENGVCHDYVSEKFWRAIHVGVVPIYFGSPTIRDWLPNEKSAILLEDYPKPKLLSQHLNKLMQDDDLYEEYLEHKTMGKITNKKLIDELRIRPYQTDHLKNERSFICLLCKKLHEKEKGVNIVTTSHYNCPKPISALSQKVELNNKWTGTWEYGKLNAKTLHDLIMPS
ncbi:alpha-(1,3)-fucosyltransferase B-like [Hyposmocoma kahamanoa]|uniref:alpha-(1,3)-fucosyltransferase B-like n=1 Tax=Hyposmocoma kahamanoa TaxID=1477025 RepID=UPI000E6D7DB9|nr:alpha-(1,3)-fucosyltransferase B-like [Hyposmocoma kahamanoa]